MSSTRRLPLGALLAYAALGPPLAMSALPVYVNLPEFYGRGLHLQVAGIGLMFLLMRALDALQDPWLGRWSDRMAAAGGSGRTRMIAWATPVICGGQWLLFNPPATLLGSPWLWPWLSAALLLTYLGFSAATISYLALAADLHRDPHERTRLAAAREGIGLFGVMIAAAAPTALAQHWGDVLAFRWFSLGLIPALLLGGIVTVRGGRRRLAALPASTVAAAAVTGGGGLRALWAPLAVGDFRRLLLVFLLSGTASSIPLNLVLFYIRDVIGRPELGGLFLLAYFLAGALGMPLWVLLARRLGKVNAWAVAMALTLCALAWAFGLRTGDWRAYLAVCVMAGLAFGGDIALPPSLLSDLVDRHLPAGAGVSGNAGQGSYLGIWTLVSKLNLALSAGLSLPLLGWLGYVPGAPIQAGTTLALAGIYSLLPCLLKAAALTLLLRNRHLLSAGPTGR